MPDFRKLFIALAVVALFAGLASAQVGTITGPAANTAFTCGVTNGAVTPTLRAEGYTELTGDIVIICSGGFPAASGTLIPTANITLFMNTTVTSRLLPTSTAATASEALLLIDEPGSGLAGYGPSVPQTVCQIPSGTSFVSAPQVGAGPGGCSEYIGTIGANAGVPVNGVGGTTPGANVFQGVTSGNQVTFFGIPVQPPVSGGLTRVFRITNVRVNANQVTAGGSVPGSVTASISINSSTSLAITNSTLTVGFVQQGLSATGTLLTSNASTTSSTAPSLAQCSSASITSTSTSSTSPVGVLQFQENFATAFKTRVSGATQQNVPGTIYNSESGFVQPLVTSTVSGTGATYVAGMADYGTRLKATFNNIPSGVSLFVSTRDIINDFNATNTTTQAQLVIGETAPDSPSGSGGTIGPTVIPAASQTGTFGIVQSSGITAVPYAPVAINAATGTGLAVWEIINTNPNQIDTVRFGLFLAYSANAAANSPAPGTLSVTLSFAPTPSGGSFTSATGSTASSTLTIPRFSDSLDISKNVATIVLCTTPLLFPYVINVNGFDTGIAIANTTTDPFGTPAQAGTCSYYFYGSSAPTTEPFVTPVVATGTVYPNLASTLAPGFSGYMIANCNFQFAHGFAFVSDVGARNLAMGYLALIFPSTNRSATEALNN